VWPPGSGPGTRHPPTTTDSSPISKPVTLSWCPRFVGSTVPMSSSTTAAASKPDVVIAATGYRCGLEPLVGHLGVLDPAGRPTTSRGDAHPDAPGLYVNGYRVDMTGQLRLMRRDAEALATTLDRTPA